MNMLKFKSSDKCSSNSCLSCFGNPKAEDCIQTKLSNICNDSKKQNTIRIPIPFNIQWSQKTVCCKIFSTKDKSSNVCPKQIEEVKVNPNQIFICTIQLQLCCDFLSHLKWLISVRNILKCVLFAVYGQRGFK